nr:hypothetical protein [Tanacetum cinerariifolium]
MGRDTVQLETAVNTISHEYLLEFTSEYGIRKALHPELPRLEDRIVDLPEGKSVIHPDTGAHLSIDSENSQMMGYVGPTTASATPEIPTIR